MSGRVSDTTSLGTSQALQGMDAISAHHSQCWCPQTSVHWWLLVFGAGHSGTHRLTPSDCLSVRPLWGWGTLCLWTWGSVHSGTGGCWRSSQARHCKPLWLLLFGCWVTPHLRLSSALSERVARFLFPAVFLLLPVFLAPFPFP